MAQSNSIHHLLLDLSSLQSVVSAAQSFLSRESRLHVLFNNASVLYPDPRARSAEGYEDSFASAVLGHHVFTMSLINALKRTAADGGGVRVVTTSSYAAHDVYKPQKLDFSILEETEMGDFQLYGRSKL